MTYEQFETNQDRLEEVKLMGYRENFLRAEMEHLEKLIKDLQNERLKLITESGYFQSVES